MTTRFLSPSWLEQATALAAGDDQLRRSTADVDLTVQQVVTGVDGEDVRYCVRIDHGTVVLEPGVAAAPDVVITQDYETAAALSQGRLSPAEAFTRSLVKVKGNVGRLVESQDAFAGLGDVFAPLRQRTEY